MAELLRSTWSDAVSNDPKHRPQVMDWPSTTVRKEWCRRPQEAHVVDGRKIVVMGIRGISNTKVYVLLHRINERNTHHSPYVLAIGNQTWMTLGELFKSIG